jgi:hypothetical protein
MTKKRKDIYELGLSWLLFDFTKYQDIANIRKRVLFEPHKNKPEFRKSVYSFVFAYDETSTMKIHLLRKKTSDNIIMIPRRDRTDKSSLVQR